MQEVHIDGTTKNSRIYLLACKVKVTYWFFTWYVTFLIFQERKITMRLKYSFEPVDMGDEIISVPVGKGANQVHGVLKLNNEGLEILNLLINDTTEEQIISTLALKYENEPAQLSAFVHKVITILHEADLLKD